MGLETTDPRLVLKATPPKLPKSVLPRQRLSLGNPGFCEKSVIAVSAPSGFGKTTLLGQWRREALAQGAVVAWLTVDQWDDDGRFAEGLAVAMQLATSRPKPLHAYPAMLDSADRRLEGLTRWLAEVITFAGELVLILDDVQALPKATTLNSLTYLLRHAPANLKIILASRKPLALPLSDLMARGQFVSVDAEAMRLDAAETSAILAARFGTRIDAESSAQIHQRTEGWHLGLQLIMSNLEKRPNLREAISGCLVSSGDIRRYFVESLIEGLTEHESYFLVCVAFVDALHPELCQAITGREDSAEILARLCDETPIFIGSLDTPWLRIHPLASEFLSEQFEALPEADRNRYRANAAHWLAEHKYYEEAGRHALRCGQEELAYEFAERCLYDVLVTGQITRVAEWMSRIPLSELQRRPRLSIALGWTLAHSARNAEAEIIVGHILDDPDADLGNRYESAQLIATAAVFADDFDRAEAISAAWRKRFLQPTPVQQLIATNVQATLALFRGEPEQTRYLLTEQTIDEQSGGAYAGTWRNWLIAMSYFWQGQVVAAEEWLRATLAEAESIAGRRSPLAAMLGATLAAVLWDRNQCSEIVTLLAGRSDVVDRHTPPDTIIFSYTTAARMAARDGDSRLAYELLERLFTVGKNRDLPRLCITSLVEQIRMAALLGRETACTLNLERLTRITGPGTGGTWGMLQHFVELQSGLALAYRHIACGDWQTARQALGRIKPIAEQLHRNKDWLQIFLLEALATRHCGLDGDGTFLEGLFIVDGLGLQQLLTDTHPELPAWAMRLRKEPRSGAAAPGFAPGVPVQVTHWLPRSADNGPKKVTPSVLLTPKERDVLGLLASNLSNKEIAVALDVSVQTVKWHLKNLFGKFDAGSRKHLIDRARMLGLLD